MVEPDGLQDRSLKLGSGGKLVMNWVPERKAELKSSHQCCLFLAGSPILPCEGKRFNRVRFRPGMQGNSRRRGLQLEVHHVSIRPVGLDGEFDRLVFRIEDESLA